MWQSLTAHLLSGVAVCAYEKGKASLPFHTRKPSTSTHLHLQLVMLLFLTFSICFHLKAAISAGQGRALPSPSVTQQQGQTKDRPAGMGSALEAPKAPTCCNGMLPHPTTAVVAHPQLRKTLPTETPVLSAALHPPAPTRSKVRRDAAKHLNLEAHRQNESACI